MFTKALFKRVICILHLLVLSYQGFSQNAISERRKIRYLKKIERKNERHVAQEEKKTAKFLSKLSKKEKELFAQMDSTKLDSSVVKNGFSKIEEQFNKEENSPEQLLTKFSQPTTIEKSISLGNISENLDGQIKDYLKQQLTATSFLEDTSCTTCVKLKKQTDKAKASIAKTSEKLEKLKETQAKIKSQQEKLKNYGIATPELGGKLKEMEKSCYYYNQGMNGFNDLYTAPSKGIESGLLKRLSFNKDFKLFSGKLNALPISADNLSALGGGTPDMTGYQTKSQVQAMLPQNAQGITPEAKSQIIANIQESVTKFSELRDEQPNLAMFKDKPEFKVNPYKGLPLRKRLVPSFTFQPQVKTPNAPITIDVGATLGFKLTERLTPMIGGSTKIGLGEDIRHLAFSYEGIVARAGFDTKLIYGFSFQGWYESTLKPYPTYLAKEDRMTNKPQPSLIAGICNTYKISKKVSGTFMIGYDFFYNKHTPYTSPWVIRMGWK